MMCSPHGHARRHRVPGRLVALWLLLTLLTAGSALAQGGLISPGDEPTPPAGAPGAAPESPGVAPGGDPGATPSALPGGAPQATPEGEGEDGGVVGQRPVTTPATATPAVRRPNAFQEAMARLMAWWRKEMVFLLSSLLGAFLAMCLISWGLGTQTNLRPAAAPPAAGLITFFLWGGAVVYFTLYRAMGAAFWTLGWAFWLILGLAALSILLLLAVSFSRRNAH